MSRKVIRLLFITLYACLCSSIVVAEDTSLLALNQDSPYQFKLSLSRSEGKSLYYFKITCKEIEGEPVIDVVEKPSRLVLDFKGIRFSTNRSFPVSENPHIQQLRFGRHEEVGRIVIDFKTEAPPSLSRVSASNGYVVAFGWDETKNDVVKNNIQLRSSPSSTPSLSMKESNQSIISHATATSTQTPTVSISKKPSPLTSPMMSTTASSSAKGVINEDKNSLTSMAFNATTRSVLIRLTHEPRYTLTKRDATSYVATVSHCLVSDKRLNLPQMPDENFPSWRFVQARSPGDACEIYVGVDAGVELKAFHKDSVLELSEAH